MYVICSEVRSVEISSPNECDKILKIPNEQTEPTDYMANCSTDMFKFYCEYDIIRKKQHIVKLINKELAMTTFHSRC